MNMNFNIHITIDDRIIAFFKGAFSRKNFFVMAVIVALTVSAIVFAAVTKPHTFTPGTVISSSQVNENFDAAFRELSRMAPVGAIVAWHKSMFNTPTLPDGWVECNGQVLNDSESVYNGQTIPNLNGKFQSYHSKGVFLRGDHSSGTFENDSFQGHHHAIYYLDELNAGTGGNTIDRMSTGPKVRYNFVKQATTDGINGDPRIDAETRPVNMSVVWIMRVK